MRLRAAAAVAFALDELEHTGIRVVTSLDDGYPTLLVERLGPAAPPLLAVAGDPALLDRPAVVSDRYLGGAEPEVVVVAGSLLRVVARPEVRRAITRGRLCVCSPYAPAARDSALHVRGRDTIIEALAPAGAANR